jgi:GNAT superfamily N-acetyltransferase
VRSARRKAARSPYSHPVATADSLLTVYDRQMRGLEPAPPAGVRYERDGPLVRAVGGRHGYISGPPDVGVTGPELDRLIVRQRDYFARRGEAVGWPVRAHDRPADLAARLRAAGFVPGPERAVLVGLAAELAAAPVLPGGIALRWVTAASDLHRIAALQCAVWGPGWGWLGEHLIAGIAADPAGIAVLAAEADGEVVSAGWLAFSQPGADSFARLLGGATLPPWRRRGIYRALVAARAQRATARGVTYLHVDASDDSAPVLRRLGFREVTSTTAYVWTPPPATPR